MTPITFNSFDEIKQQTGSTLPVGKWFTVSQKMINDFANATLDNQWIHVDAEKAKQYSPFKTTVAHGFMSVAMLSKKIEELITIHNISMGLNYGVNKVRFPHPVPVNSELRLHCTIKNVEDFQQNGIKITFKCTMEIKGVEKPACVAEFITVLFS